MRSITVSPLNPVAIEVGPFNEMSSVGVETPIGTGTFTGFLATSDEPTATTAHADFEVTLSYIGGANGYEAGMWMYQLAGSVLTVAKCVAAFGSVARGIWLIVKRDDVVRGAIRVTYKPSRHIEVTE